MKQKALLGRISAMVGVGLAASLALFVSPALPAMAAPPNFPSFTELHTVTQSDNNIQVLAQEFGTTADNIIAANGLTNPGNINYGQQLWVPPASSSMAEAPAMMASPSAPAGKVPGLAAPAAANPSFTETYTVVQGDNLWALAQKFGTTINDLAAANNISDPSKLSIGEQLHVPAMPAAPAASAPSAPAARTPGLSAPTAAYSSFTQSHTVAQGDNLWTLAKKYGTTVNDLAAANSISDPSKLSIGEKLWVPAAPTAPAGSSNSTMLESPAMPASPQAAPGGQ